MLEPVQSDEVHLTLCWDVTKEFLEVIFPILPERHKVCQDWHNVLS